MKVYIWRGEGFTNFGDELNVYLFERLLNPAIHFDERPGLVLGIGTVLHAPMPVIRPMVVFGSGAGYGPLPDMDNVEIIFVRGPKSARIVGPGTPWITDPGMLVEHFIRRKPDVDVSFVPHWKTIDKDPDLVARMKDIGVQVIDPRGYVDEVLRRIAGSRLIVSEALHGAVVADALRIPWIPVYGQHGHLFKWIDWCQSIGLAYDPEFVEVSSMNEMIRKAKPFLSRDAMHKVRLNELDKATETLRRRLA